MPLEDRRRLPRMHRFRTGLQHEQLTGLPVLRPFHVHGRVRSADLGVVLFHRHRPAGEREQLFVVEDVPAPLLLGQRQHGALLCLRGSTLARDLVGGCAAAFLRRCLRLAVQQRRVVPDTAKLLGHDYLIVPTLPPDTATSLDRWREWADRFNAAGAAARKAGVWLAFHNEPDHMKPIGAGTIPYDLFVERTDPSVVRHQLDIGNMALGGADPLRYFEKYRARYWSFHIKDVVADRSKNIELGKGVVEIRRLLAAVPDITSKPVYVEQEEWADSMASARANYDYLSTLDF